MRSWLGERKQAYLLGVTSQYRIFTGERRQWAKDVIAELAGESWQTCSCGEGSKGERWYEWARLEVRHIDDGWQRWLLARRSLSKPQEIAYYVVGGPKQAVLEEMARVAGSRWAIEESFEVAKGELGLDHYEVRSWAGWYRHVTLVMMAHAYLTVQGARAADEGAGAEKKRRRQKSSVLKNSCR